jgi:hypothetical protein
METGMLYDKSVLRSATGKDREIIERINDFHAYALSPYQIFCNEAQVDSMFLAGSQEFYNNLYGPLFKERCEGFYFNRIRPIVNGISGRQRQQRKTSIVVPRENADQKTADQLSKVLMWVMENDNMLYTVSEAFYGAITTGINMLYLWIDYRTDPLSGDIRVTNCPYNSFLIDPNFTRQDLSDCNGILRRSFLPQREICSLLPEYTDIILSLHPSNTEPQYLLNNSMMLRSHNLMSYDEFWFRDYRTQTLLLDNRTGDIYEWKGTDIDLEIFLYNFPDIEKFNNEIPTVSSAIIVEGTVICSGNFIGLDSYPFIPVVGYYQPELENFNVRIQGVVRGMRDAQYIYNRRLILESQNLEATVSSGWIYKEGAVVNPDDLYRTGTGRSIAIKDGFALNDALAAIQQQVIPPTTQQLRQSYADEILRDSGYNEDMLGAGEDETAAGVLVMLRQRAGLVTFEKLFDQLDLSQKILSNKILSLIQNQFMPAKIRKILADDDELSPSFHNRLFGVYDCVVEEGYYTSTQKQVQFAQLMELRKLGVQIPDDVLVQAATIQNKDDIVKAMTAQQQQAMQLQQQEAQMRMKELEAEIDVLKSKAQSDKALAAERMSSIDENKMSAIERIAEAEKDQQTAKLTHAKMIKELKEMDITKLEKLLSLSRMLKGEIDEEYKESSGRVQADTAPSMGSQGQFSGEYGV